MINFGEKVWESPKVSVIVPVYKVEKYLPECIGSILAQTFTDFELILADDGSPDNSGKICDDYAARDFRIRVFHKENGGVSSARNLGIDNARGEWIAFVDSDDWIGRDFLSAFFFEKKLLKGEKIKIFNYGNCKRDFTYIDDIIEGIVRIIEKAPKKEVGSDGLPIPPYKVYNIGNSVPENLLDFVNILQEELILAGVLPADYDFESHKELVPMQAGDVPVTFADTSDLEKDFGFKPSTSLREGLRKFAVWYAAAQRH